MAAGDIPSQYRSETGLAFVIDNNLIDDESAEMIELRKLHLEGWVNLTRTDVIDTELLNAPGDRRERLLGLSDEYVELFGPMVLGHSRLGASVLGSEEDGDRLRQVFGLLFRGRDMATSRKQNVRDAMNIATAIRYGANGFVTKDEDLLKRGAAVKEAFNGFLVYSPAQVLTVVRRMVRKHQYRTAHPLPGA